MNLRFVPLNLKDFPSPRPAEERRYSLFKAPWNRTLKQLESELAKLGASNVVLQAGFTRHQIRQDGWPYRDLSPAHPCIILSFQDADKRALSFPCDRFLTYQENLRAIVLSLEALRAVDRFGVTKRSEQYAGFKAIEAVKTWTVDDAALFLDVKTGVRADVLIGESESYRLAYRAAAKLLHPDQGGNPHEWKLLQDARVLLDTHHGFARGVEAR